MFWYFQNDNTCSGIDGVGLFYVEGLQHPRLDLGSFHRRDTKPGFKNHSKSVSARLQIGIFFFFFHKMKKK